QDGTGAQEAYLEAVSEGTGEGRKKELEEGLRRYCGMDVGGMVGLAGFLAGTREDVRGSVYRCPCRPRTEPRLAGLPNEN
ncbi:MAG: hypothetical protein KBE42_13425, partial [Steroidobacteraceae bacterium]|nr:hypothetical protein [Steroidobacteraceae bacterium]